MLSPQIDAHLIVAHYWIELQKMHFHLGRTVLKSWVGMIHGPFLSYPCSTPTPFLDLHASRQTPYANTQELLLFKRAPTSLDGSSTCNKTLYVSMHLSWVELGFHTSPSPLHICVGVFACLRNHLYLWCEH